MLAAEQGALHQAEQGALQQPLSIILKVLKSTAEQVLAPRRLAAATKYPNFLPPLHPRGASVSPVIIRIITTTRIIITMELLMTIASTGV